MPTIQISHGQAIRSRPERRGLSFGDLSTTFSCKPSKYPIPAIEHTGGGHSMPIHRIVLNAKSDHKRQKIPCAMLERGRKREQSLLPNAELLVNPGIGISMSQK